VPNGGPNEVGFTGQAGWPQFLGLVPIQDFGVMALPNKYGQLFFHYALRFMRGHEEERVVFFGLTLF
jgi:hypothetical protein